MKCVQVNKLGPHLNYSRYTDTVDYSTSSEQIRIVFVCARCVHAVQNSRQRAHMNTIRVLSLYYNLRYQCTVSCSNEVKVRNIESDFVGSWGSFRATNSYKFGSLYWRNKTHSHLLVPFNVTAFLSIRNSFKLLMVTTQFEVLHFVDSLKPAVDTPLVRANCQRTVQRNVNLFSVFFSDAYAVI